MKRRPNRFFYSFDVLLVHRFACGEGDVAAALFRPCVHGNVGFGQEQRGAYALRGEQMGDRVDDVKTSLPRYRSERLFPRCARVEQIVGRPVNFENQGLVREHAGNST